MDFFNLTRYIRIMAKCPYSNKVIHLHNLLLAPRSKTDKPDPVESLHLDKTEAHMWVCPLCDKIIAITEVPR